MPAKITVICDSDDRNFQLSFDTESGMGTLLVRVDPALIETHDSGAQWLKRSITQLELSLIQRFLKELKWP